MYTVVLLVSSIRTFCGREYGGQQEDPEISSMYCISMTVISGLEVKQHLSAALGRVPGYRYKIWHEIISNFFLPKSNPYIPLVNFQKKIRFFSFNFRQNFDVRTFPQ